MTARMLLCIGCGQVRPLGVEQCPKCHGFESRQIDHEKNRLRSNVAIAQSVPMRAPGLRPAPRRKTGIVGLDRVLGGGIVHDAVTLVYGEPSIGKSTLLLQALAAMASPKCHCLYATGEEGEPQVRQAARRVGADRDDVYIVATRRLEDVLINADRRNAQVLVADSIQTFRSDTVPNSAGSVTQVKHVTEAFIAHAKRRLRPTAILLVGHVTGDGDVAGPKSVEHLVDVMVEFSGDRRGGLRFLQSPKNRHGAVGELAVMEMTAKGLIERSDTASAFLSPARVSRPGTVVFASADLARPIMVEIEARVDRTEALGEQADGTPILRRGALGILGIESSRIRMLLACLEQEASVSLSGRDIYLEAYCPAVPTVSDQASDLAVLAAIASASTHRAVPRDAVIFGSVSVSGRVRKVERARARMDAAYAGGFTRALIPAANVGDVPKGMVAHSIEHVSGLAAWLATLDLAHGG